MYWLYIIECGDGTYYTGITTDVERRFQQHQAGTASRYTRARGAKKLLYTEEAGNRSEASKREAAVKKLSREQKKELIAG